MLGVVVVGGDDEVGLWNERGKWSGFEGSELRGTARPANPPSGVGGKRCFV